MKWYNEAMLQLTTIFFLIAASVLAVLHNVALYLFLYWRFWWFDIPMHGLGGAVVALGLFTAYDFRLFKNKSFLKVHYVLAFVIFIALLWEVYEILIGVPIEREGFVLDTITDLLMGFLGGYVGYIVGNSIRKLH